MAVVSPPFLDDVRQVEHRGWFALRMVLLATTVLIVMAGLLLGQRTSSLDDLYSAVQSGQVTTVHVSGGLPPGAQGSALEEFTWRDGLFRHRAEATVVSPGTDTSDVQGAVETRDPLDQIRAVNDQVRIVGATAPTSWTTVLGMRVPSAVMLVVIAQGLAVLFLLMNGPSPWRVTRWGWFWLSWTAVGPLAFLVLSGPVPGVPRPRPGRAHLTGGRALLLAVLLGTLLPKLWG